MSDEVALRGSPERITSRNARKTLLDIRELRVAYPQGGEYREALRGVSLKVAAGQFVALVGESGSGKSTIAKAVAGLLPEGARISGGIWLEGRDVSSADEELLRSLRGRAIGVVPQDPLASLDSLMRAGRHVEEAIFAHAKPSRSEARDHAADALARAGLPKGDRVYSAYPHELSGGMKQRVLIAAGMVNGPSLLIADEPTSALDATVQRTILDNISRLVADSGTAVLFITHNLALAVERADQVIVLRNGQVVESGPSGRVWDRPAHEYTKSLIAALPDARTPRIGSAGSPSAVASPLTIFSARGFGTSSAAQGGRPREAEILRLEDVRARYRTSRDPALDRISLSFRRGSVVALIGESGSGKTTLGSIVLGLMRPEGGRVLFRDRDLLAMDRRELGAYRREVQAVFQNPFGSMNPRFTVRRILEEPLAAFGIGGKQERATMAREVLDRVGLPRNVLESLPRELSGGQCQRVAIARAVIAHPSLLVCDEPTSSLDVLVQARILDLMAELRRELGIGYLLISHDLGLVRSIADEVVVLKSGRIAEAAATEELFERPRSEYARALLDAIPSRRRAPDRAFSEAKGEDHGLES
jgi:peptide/nickel transport system ATP-binding protein